MDDLRMTPAMLMIALHYHIRVDQYSSGNWSPSHRDMIRKLEEAGLLRPSNTISQNPDAKGLYAFYEGTPELDSYIEELMSVPVFKQEGPEPVVSQKSVMQRLKAQRKDISDLEKGMDFMETAEKEFSKAGGMFPSIMELKDMSAFDLVIMMAKNEIQPSYLYG